MKLSEAEIGEYTVHRVLRKDKMEQRLRILGIYPGARITLTEIGTGGVRILCTRGMRLALGRQVASKITVNPR